MLRDFAKAGQSVNDVEDMELETLVKVFCEKGQKKPKKIDLMDYMKMEKGVTMS